MVSRSFMQRATVGLFLGGAICGGARAEEAASVDMSVPSTAIVVTPFHKAYFTRGDDGKVHVEYDLLVTNTFSAPVTLSAIEITDAAGKALMRIEGDALVEATQTILEQKPVKAIDASSSVAVEIDLILPPGEVPSRVSHRIAYDFPANAPLATGIGLREVVGPEVEVDTAGPIPIASPLSGPGWATFNGCCTPNIHRNTRIGAGTRIATSEVFAIDWIQIRGNKFFDGDGKLNEQYPYFGADVTSATDGEVLATRDGMPESNPFLAPRTVHKPEDYGGNYVMVRMSPEVFAFYAHLQPGTVAVKVGDRVKAGQLLGKLGNTGNSTAPHLHFGLLDRPDALTGDSLPFVIDGFKVTGRVTGGDLDGFDIEPASRDVKAAYPLVGNIAEFK